MIDGLKHEDALMKDAWDAALANAAIAEGDFGAVDALFAANENLALAWQPDLRNAPADPMRLPSGSTSGRTGSRI
jgi:hypothetical protein